MRTTLYKAMVKIMPRYIRSSAQGGIYFFTLVAYERRKILCNDDFLHAFRQSIKHIQQQYPFEILAWVQMPDHLHCIWQLPIDDSNFSMRWSQIKRLTTKACPQYHLSLNNLSASKMKRNEKGIWQRRFYEHKIRNEQDLITHMDYLHYNPVKHGVVDNVMDWQYSSFHRLVREGSYPADWGSDGIEFSDSFATSLE